MLFRKIFEVLHSAMAFLVLLNKLRSNFLPLIRSPSRNMTHFVRKFRFMRAYFRPGVDLENFGWEMQF